MAVTLSPGAMDALRHLEAPAARPAADPGVAGGDGASFADVLKGAIQEAGKAEQQAEQTAAAFSRGEAGIHETIMAQERASIAVRYAVTVKNKALEAYRELMNTQI